MTVYNWHRYWYVTSNHAYVYIYAYKHIYACTLTLTLTLALTLMHAAVGVAALRVHRGCALLRPGHGKEG